MSYTKTQRIVNAMHGSTKKERSTPVVHRANEIMDGMAIPNHSGVTNHPEFKHRIREWNFTIIDPNAVYNKDTQVFIAHIYRPIVVTEIHVELNTAAQNVAGDLKHASNFIGLAGGSLIVPFDTTAGVLSTTTITNPEVAADRHLYLDFDAQPNSAIGQMHVTIFYYEA